MKKNYEKFLEEGRIIECSNVYTNRTINSCQNIEIKKTKKDFSWMLDLKDQLAEHSRPKHQLPDPTKNFIQHGKQTILNFKEAKSQIKAIIDRYMNNKQILVKRKKQNFIQMRDIGITNIKTKIRKKNFDTYYKLLSKSKKDIEQMNSKLLKSEQNSKAAVTKRCIRENDNKYVKLLITIREKEILLDKLRRNLQQHFIRLKSLDRFFKSWHYKVEFNLHEIYDAFKNYSDQNDLSFNKFYTSCKELGLTYKKILKKSGSQTKNFKLFENFLIQIANIFDTETHISLFFDVSSINDLSFKQKSWALTNKNSIVKKLFTYNLTHIVALLSTTKLEAIQFIKGNLINLDLISFLNEAVGTIKMNYPGKKVVILLDNARMHYTEYFKNFAEVNRIQLIYIPPSSPMLNPIEYFFRYIKTSLKKIHTLL